MSILIEMMESSGWWEWLIPGLLAFIPTTGIFFLELWRQTNEKKRHIKTTLLSYREALVLWCGKFDEVITFTQYNLLNLKRLSQRGFIDPKTGKLICQNYAIYSHNLSQIANHNLLNQEVLDGCNEASLRIRMNLMIIDDIKAFLIPLLPTTTTVDSFHSMDSAKLESINQSVIYQADFTHLNIKRFQNFYLKTATMVDLHLRHMDGFDNWNNMSLKELKGVIERIADYKPPQDEFNKGFNNHRQKAENINDNPVDFDPTQPSQ